MNLSWYKHIWDLNNVRSNESLDLLPKSGKDGSLLSTDACYTGKKNKQTGSSVKICILNDSPHPTPFFTLQVPLLCSGPTKLAATWISSGSRLEVSGETGPKKRRAHINMKGFPKLKKKFTVFLTCIEISRAWDSPDQTQALISSSAPLPTWELAKDDQTPEEISDVKKWLRQTNNRT